MYYCITWFHISLGDLRTSPSVDDLLAEFTGES